MKKQFECKDGCKNGYVEMVILGCKKCIKKIAPNLSKKQIEEITKIINNV